MEADLIREKADAIRGEDPAEASRLYREASGMGDARSASSLGYMLMTGEGVPADLEEAERHLRMAAGAGDAKAMCNLGSLVMERDPKEALELFEAAGKNGNVSGMRNAAVMLRTGAGIPIDSEGAAYWLQMAADAGDVASMSILAHMLRTGEGVPADKARACGLYRKAAEARDADSMYDLAMMLDSGDGVPVDRESAEKWFREAASRGDNDARLCLGGILYERGDYAGAESEFADAALDGDVKAMYNLALMYAGGELGEKDIGKAKEWLESASSEGFAYAQTMLASILLDEGDAKRAEELFRKAAAQNEPTAMYNLGALALSGAIRIDDEEAVNLLVKAATAGVPEAQELVRRLSSQGMLRSVVQELGERRNAVRAAVVYPGAVPAVDYGAVDAVGPRREEIVHAVPDVQGPVLGDIEMRERECYRLRIGLVADGLVPSDDDLGDPSQIVVLKQILDLEPPFAGCYADPLPARLQLPERDLRIGERHCALVRIGCHHAVEPPSELLVRRITCRAGAEDLVHRHPEIVVEPGGIVFYPQGWKGLAKYRLDADPRIVQGVVEIEQIQIVLSHLVAT